jgi:small-conductance mechanosensitive channel
MTRFIRGELAQGVRHVRDNAALLLAIAIVTFALSYWLIVATRERLEAEAESDPYARRTVNLLRAPAVAALVVALLALVRFGPAGPFGYELMLWSLLPIPAALLARAAIGPQVTLSLYTLAGAMISIALLGALVDPLPITSRLVLIAQCVAVAVALGVDLRRGHLGQALSGLSRILVRWVAAGMVVLLALAVVASATGYLGASRILRNGVLGSLGLAVVLTVAVHLLYGLTLALMQTWAARRLRIARLQPYSVHRSVRWGLVAVAWLAWVAGMLAILGLVDEATRLVKALADAEVAIGSTSIALAGVWVGLAVVLGTYVLVKVVRLVLEVEILPRLNLKQGVPFAVSAVTRYLLVTAGVVVAMAAMGIDLTEVTLLAGALGVGIGFGLQGVVNNFVSGLILLIERPINLGDVVQMGDLRGVVRRIGVRSSTVRTFQGAEVIVPNAELISREVTNWTLSDRKRRLEIDVGIAYGTEPEQVVRLLEAAAKEVADVVANPAPWAWFTGFGDSSLNFRLQAWIEDYDRGHANESELRMAIVRKFKEANIEIPFPQRVVRFVREGPDDPAAGKDEGEAG